MQLAQPLPPNACICETLNQNGVWKWLYIPTNSQPAVAVDEGIKLLFHNFPLMNLIKCFMVGTLAQKSKLKPLNIEQLWKQP